MTLFSALLIGTGLGLVGLFPGVHFAMVLLAVGPFILARFGAETGLLSMACAVVIARSMHTLAVVYHPVAADQIASADPAQKLNARGQGKLATQIMGGSLLTGVITTAIVLGVLTWMSLWIPNLTKNIIKTISIITWPAIVLWVGYTLYRAKNTLGSLLILIASGTLGIVALNYPAVRGSGQAMTPLLTGLFALPVLLMAFFQKQDKRKAQLNPEVHVSNPDVKLFGFLAGFLSVALPGLGTSSLISVGESLADTDADYLTMSSLAESIGETLALVLGILGLAQRSSDASILSRVLQQNVGVVRLSPIFPYVLLGLLILSVLVGLTVVKVLGRGYELAMVKIPQRLQILVVGTAMLWIVLVHTGAWGLGICLAGVLIHLGARQLGTPNQCFFMCLIAPMAMSMFGLTLWA